MLQSRRGDIGYRLFGVVQQGEQQGEVVERVVAWIQRELPTALRNHSGSTAIQIEVHIKGQSIRPSIRIIYDSIDTA